MITVPAYLWDTVIRMLARSPQLERAAYLDGYELAEHGVATTVTFPRAQCYPRNFSVSASAMSEAGKHLRQLGQVRLAQIHSHPGICVEHSEHDDERAYSQRIGAISIVVPNYGRGVVDLRKCGVHVRNESGWRLLRPHEAAQHIRIAPDIFDFRGAV